MPKGTMSDADADTIREYMASSKGQRKLAATMAAPLLQRMDYRSIGRRTFLVEDVPEPCASCKRTNYNEGHEAGCKECSVRSVLWT